MTVEAVVVVGDWNEPTERLGTLDFADMPQIGHTVWWRDNLITSIYRVVGIQHMPVKVPREEYGPPDPHLFVLLEFIDFEDDD